MLQRVNFIAQISLFTALLLNNHIQSSAALECHRGSKETESCWFWSRCSATTTFDTLTHKSEITQRGCSPLCVINGAGNEGCTTVSISGKIYRFCCCDGNLCNSYGNAVEKIEKVAAAPQRQNRAHTEF